MIKNKTVSTLLAAVLLLSEPLVSSFAAGSQSGSPASPQQEGTYGQDADSEPDGSPSSGEHADERRAMVANQIEGRGVENSAVLEAMRAVPRHEFVSAAQQGQAYSDKPLPIGHGQTISQPYIVAYMTQMLQLEAGDKVLEIGTGSGYQAAVLAEITNRVYTIEIIEELAAQASECLQRLGYNEVRTSQGDGYYGWEEYAPFDAIIVTAAAGHIPPPLLRQLKPGGRMLIPVGGVYEVQSLMLVRKTPGGEVRTERLMPVRFVPFRGEAQQKSGK
ncbi:MAG: protein-L-isoaspartate(D-aspartate) O-methyltransferase [Spirochaetota bacterium]